MPCPLPEPLLCVINHSGLSKGIVAFLAAKALHADLTILLQVEQALRYAKAIRGQPDDPDLAMRHDEGLGGWTPLLLVQSVYALWDAILLSPAPPPEARGPCPAQGYHYALAVYHYTRCLAFAAQCSTNSTSSACSEAREELQHLQVRLPCLIPPESSTHQACEYAGPCLSQLQTTSQVMCC